ncbi:hypothetical protein [Flavicella marina]|uniref:hypothetical protein n=1 Tax=Flavicella marina TaxID=1475951 RepID=UPI001264A842|nr:hypothetical protein [Flavicella marina]
MNKLFGYLAVLLIFSSCDLLSKKQPKKSSKIIAKVGTYQLHEEDLELIFPDNISKNDSAAVAANIIESWAKKKLLMEKARVNLPEKNAELELLVERYREDLFINSFKKALVAKELDTVVSYEEMVAFYDENKESFRINEELVKFKYIEVKPTHKKRLTYKRMLVSKSRNDLFMLDEENEELESSFLSDSLWFRYKDVQNKLPVLKLYNKSTVLKPKKLISKKHNGNMYYIYINDVLERNEIAPIRYISETIEKMVIQKRKLQLINKVEEVLIDDAKKNKQFEIY